MTNAATTSPQLAKRLILFSILTTGIGQSMTFTLLAPLGREVGLSEVQVGLIITCAALAFTTTSPIWGRASDRWGRKPVLLLGLFGYAFGYLLFASVFFYGLKGLLTGSLLYLLAISARVSMAALMSAAPSSATAYISDTTTREQRVAGMGNLGAARTLGAILGPAACGLLAVFGLLAPLYIAGSITLLSAIMVAVVMREPKRVRTAVNDKPQLKLFDQRYFPYLLIGFLSFFAFSMTNQTIGFYIQDRFALDGRSTAQALGMGLMVAAAASFFSQAVLAGRLKMAPIRLLYWGLPIAMIGYAAILFASHTVTLAIVLGVLGLGIGMISTGISAGASLSVKADEQGAVGGMIAACPAAGFIAGPIIGTSLYQFGHGIPYLCGALLMLPLTIYVRRVGKRIPKSIIKKGEVSTENNDEINSTRSG